MGFSLSKAEFIQLSDEVRVSAVMEDWQAGQDPQFSSQGKEGRVNGKNNLVSMFMKR